MQQLTPSPRRCSDSHPWCHRSRRPVQRRRHQRGSGSLFLGILRRNPGSSCESCSRPTALPREEATATPFLGHRRGWIGPCWGCVEEEERLCQWRIQMFLQNVTLGCLSFECMCVLRIGRKNWGSVSKEGGWEVLSNYSFLYPLGLQACQARDTTINFTRG